MLDTARSLIVKELSVAKGTTETKVERELEKLFNRLDPPPSRCLVAAGAQPSIYPSSRHPWFVQHPGVARCAQSARQPGFSTAF